jgi:hypothetical protein
VRYEVVKTWSNLLLESPKILQVLYIALSLTYLFMRRPVLLIFMIFYANAWSQSDFNTKSHLAIDLGYFPYQAGTRYFSSELQAKSKKQYLFAGVNVGNQFRLISDNSWQYGLKIGYGIYPYKNARRLKVHHRVNYYYEVDTKNKDWQGHFFVLGNGVEYWIIDKFTLGLNANMCWGYIPSDGPQFVLQPLVTAKYIFKER